jgi:DNA end-binding protein Ku
MSKDEPRPRPRSFWSGTISFGLVSIPVELYPANRSARVSLRMLDADGTPLRRRFFDASEKPLESDALVRGYEIDSNDFVVVTDEELESLEPGKSRDIDLRRFVDSDAIEPLWFERAYFLTPAGNSNKAYRLLAATMERTGKAGIATFVMRTREYLVAILAENGILRAETLRFHDEVRSPEDVGLPEPAQVPAAAVKRVTRAIGRLAADALDPAELQDTYARRLRELVEKKRKRGEDVVAPAAGADQDDEDDDIIDLMQVLKRSMKAAEEAGGDEGGKQPRGTARTGGTKRTAARKPAKKAAGKAAQAGGARSARTATRTAARSSAPAAARRGGAAKKEELSALTKAELYERAQALDIAGRSGMSRAALERAVRQAG